MGDQTQVFSVVYKVSDRFRQNLIFNLYSNLHYTGPLNFLLT